MITEDYCSFEVAKLLKEKGFDGECRMTYREHDMQMIYHTPNPNDLLDFTTNRKKLEKHSKNQHCDYALCPTRQTAMKWLREVHNIVIEINMEDYMTTTDGKLKVTYSYTIWTFIQHLGETGITDARYDDRAFWQENVKVGQSYEEAVEAALLYTLKNLI